MSFTEGQIVWAKMRGYPDWPARVARPPVGAKEKGIYVQFFAENGDGQYGWALKTGVTLFKKTHAEEKAPTKRNARLLACIAVAEGELDNAEASAAAKDPDQDATAENSNSEAPEEVRHDAPTSEGSPVSNMSVSGEQAYHADDAEVEEAESHQESPNRMEDPADSVASATETQQQLQDKGFIPSALIDDWVSENFLPSAKGILKSAMIWHFFEKFCIAGNYKPSAGFKKSVGNRLTRRFNAPGGYNRGAKGGHTGQLRSGLRLSKNGEKEFKKLTGLDVAKIIDRYP